MRNFETQPNEAKQLPSQPCRLNAVGLPVHERPVDCRIGGIGQFRSVDGTARIVNNLAVNAVGFGKDGLMVGCSSMAHAIK